MNKDLTYKYRDLLKKNFGEWVDDLKRNGKNVGEIMAEIWNQYAEDIMNEAIGVLDLEKKEDFATLFIDGRYIEIARETGLPPKEKRWVFVDNSQNDVISKEDYHFYDEDDMVELCQTEIASIAECIIAWPSLYSRELYEAIIWPVIKAENWLDMEL